MEATGLRPTRSQQGFIDLVNRSEAKYFTLVSSRQAGKTTLMMNFLLQFSINHAGARVAFISPTYQQVRKVMEDLYNAIAHTKITKKVNYSTYEIHLYNGSIIHFRSAENFNALRGYTFTHLIIDEASYIREEAWRSAIQPTVLVKGLTVILCSTPRNKDFFYDLYQLGKSPDHPNYESYRMTYEGNPYVDMQEIEAARKTLPKSIFRAEYEGQFVEGESMVFDDYTKTMFTEWPKPRGRVFAGCDLGKESDYTVCVFIDEYGSIVEIYRDNKKDWSYMIEQIISRVKKYNASLMVEKNSIGGPVSEMLRKQWNRTDTFVTTNRSKQEIVEGLILDFHENNIAIPSAKLFPELQAELDVFEMKYSPKSRSVQYAAREPFHDDIIIATCIANYNRKQRQGGQFAVMGGGSFSRP